MKHARWTTAVAAAALIALPAAAFAQSPQGAPPQNPPAQSQPPATTSQQPPAAQAPAAAGQVDAAAAKQRLSEARETLSALTTMPEAAKLQGDARTQISQLITNFNALITTQADWRAAYGKVNENLTALLGPEAGDQPVGTSGSGSIDPAIRAKLVEFRTQLKAFESAAGGGAPSPAGSGGTMPPANPTTATTNPSNPASPANPAPAKPSSATTSPAASTDPKPATDAAPNAEVQKELDAISTILNSSKTGTLTKGQTDELKRHVETLRALLASR